MNAPTTTGENDSSGGGNGERGWFTPPKASSAASREPRRDQHDGDEGIADPRGRQDVRGNSPGSVPSSIRPVGNAAERARTAEAQPTPPPWLTRLSHPGDGDRAVPPLETTPAQATPGRQHEHQHESQRHPVRDANKPDGPEGTTRTAQPAEAAGHGEAPRSYEAAEPGEGPRAAAQAPTSYQAARPGEAVWPDDPGTWPDDTASPDEVSSIHGTVEAEHTEHAEDADVSAPPTSNTWPAAAVHGTPSATAADTPEPEAAPGPSAGAASTAASPTAVLIRRTMTEIGPVADKVTSYFYALLFVRHPELRALFPAAMDAQRDRLFKALLTAAEHVDDADTLTDYLSHLGRGHRKYGTRPEHYPAVGECLLGALARYAPDTWGPEAEAAWVHAYTAVSQIMIDAAAADEAVSPAWWHAEVVSHELRTPDIAVVTVRPDQPYPFLAGQYTTLETPWWPRVWRHYSFASAPRSDGLLSFHVKAVPAGWVSGALVHRARPGDVIRLGPPAGSMTVDHTTDNGLLCLGGGTGIAPIRALVEDVAEHGRRRLMDVFYGARTGSDLYDIDSLLTLARKHPWLSVRPVVATGPVGGEVNSISGQLPDAVRQYGPWRAYDAYLSGPAGMVRSGVDALMGSGMPSERIRHDFIEELVTAGD
ncbi:globin domain-containing protein [Streptomyces sp. NPDC001691]|uniref:globin domain-containing protein n=1 Tax=Streptomyces sp. NPDC001691 TaxID=3364600 RepID=UPI0036751FB8